MPVPRILVVDDDRDGLTVLARLLRLAGHEVQTAASVGEALTVAGGHPCDVLVTDIGLPDGNGFDLMRKLKTMYPLPAIALTGWTEEQSEQGGQAAGFERYLVKPVQFDELLTAIRDLTTTGRG